VAGLVVAGGVAAGVGSREDRGVGPDVGAAVAAPALAVGPPWTGDALSALVSADRPFVADGAPEAPAVGSGLNTAAAGLDEPQPAPLVEQSATPGHPDT
jgi:hypothetical protein